MNEDKITELFFNITKELATLNTNMKVVLDKLSMHEQRILNLETNKNKDNDWKTNLLMLLAKATVIGAVAIGSLSGASSIIAKIFGVG